MPNHIFDEKREELESENYRLAKTSHDKMFYYFVRDNDDRMIIISKDVNAAQAFAELCSGSPDNPHLPTVYSHDEEKGLYITEIERLNFTEELPETKAKLLKRMARTMMNYVVRYDPYHDAVNSHRDVYAYFDSDESVRDLADSIKEMVCDPPYTLSGSLVFELDAENAMYRDDGRIVFVAPFREPVAEPQPLENKHFRDHFARYSSGRTEEKPRVIYFSDQYRKEHKKALKL